MALRVERERVKYPDGRVVYDFQADTTSDLPALGSKLGRNTVGWGSIAQIVQADEPTYMTLGSNGTWYPDND